MSQKFKSELELQALNNATTDTDKFLVSDSGVVKYRTGNEVLSDLGITLNTASKLQHLVKAGVAINKGQAVYVTGADGTNMIVGLASNASEATSSKTMGLLDATVAINGFANVVTEGLLAGLNTVGANAGDPVWLGTGGNLIYGLLNKPYAPAHLVFIGIVTRVNANNGEIFVKVQNGFELNEIHDVDLKTTTPINGHILGFDGTLWVNKTIAGWLGYTPWHPGNDGSGSGLDADLLDGYHASAFQLALTNPVTGTGTTNYVSKFTSATTLGNSQIFDNGTNVGIGTTTPFGKLSVDGGDFRFNYGNDAANRYLWFNKNNSYDGGVLWTRDNSTADWQMSNASSSGDFFMYSFGTGTSVLTIKRSNGNVGIGTTSPSEKLHISGNTLVTGTLEVDTVNNGVGDFLTRTAGGIVTRRTAAEVRSDIGAQAALTNPVTGTGTLNFVSKFTSTGSTLGNSQIFDNGTNVGVGTTDPTTKLSVSGRIRAFGVGNAGIITSEDTQPGGAAISLNPQFSTNVPGIQTGNSPIAFYTNGSEKMRITSGGNVGIGTTSPPSKLSISGGTLSVSGSGSGFGVVKLGDPTDANPYVGMYRSAAASIATSGNFLNLGGYDGIAFTTGAAQLSGQPERMRITSSGFVGIGTTAPTYRLQVSDTIASVTAFGNFAALQSIGGTGYRWSLNNDSTFRLQYTTNGFSTITTPLFVTSNGALGVGVTPTNTAGRLEAANDIVAYSSSDRRWKTNIKNIDSPLEKISQINGVEFDWIEDEPVHGNKGHDIGVIAQEIEKILPDAVQTRESGMKAVKYEKVIPLLIEAVKEQQKQIEELKQLLNGITK